MWPVTLDEPPKYAKVCSAACPFAANQRSQPMHPTGHYLIHFHPSITINLMRLNCGVGGVQRRLLSSRNAALQALYLCTNQWVWIKPLVAHQYRAHVAQFSYDETLSDGMSPDAIGICL